MDKEDDFEYDPVKGEHGKKSKMSALNKKTLTKQDLDEFAQEIADYKVRLSQFGGES